MATEPDGVGHCTLPPSTASRREIAQLDVDIVALRVKKGCGRPAISISASPAGAARPAVLCREDAGSGRRAFRAEW